MSKALTRSAPFRSRVPGRAPVRSGTVTFRPFTRPVPLVHTVKRPSTVRPLVRTVLRDTSHRFTGGLVRSPLLLVRASGRSVGLLRAVARSGISQFITVPAVAARAFACARRAIRREVLFARGHGGGKHRPPSYRSSWRC